MEKKDFIFTSVEVRVAGTVRGTSVSVVINTNGDDSASNVHVANAVRLAVEATLSPAQRVAVINGDSRP